MRARIYDAVIVHMTAGWYRAVIARLPDGCRLLDVGIGTGGALVANAAEVLRKRLRVVGVDIDRDYVERCNRALAEARLASQVEARCESIYDHGGGPYDAIYFSASFMLLPEPVEALRHVSSLLAPGGRIYFTQTFENRRSAAMERLKPLLRLVTTIDFGRVTYEADFRRATAAGGVAVEELVALSPGRSRSGILAVGRPERTGC
jgi:SAM-dependent methyltransferase